MENRDASGEGKREREGGKIKQEARIFEVPQPSGVCGSALSKLRKSSSPTRGAPRVNGIGSYVEPVVRTDVLRRPRVVVASYVGLLLRLAEPRRAGLADKAHRAAPCLPGPDSPSRTHLLHLAHRDRVPEPTRRIRLPHSAASPKWPLSNFGSSVRRLPTELLILEKFLWPSRLLPEYRKFRVCKLWIAADIRSTKNVHFWI